MAWVDDVTGQFEQAWRRFDRAVAVTERLGDRALLASVLCNRGDIDFSCGEWERADHDFSELVPLHVRLVSHGRPRLPPVAHGMLLLARGQWVSASHQIEVAIDLAERTANVEVLRWAHGAVAERELLQGRPEQSERRGNDWKGCSIVTGTKKWMLRAYSHCSLGHV